MPWLRFSMFLLLAAVSATWSLGAQVPQIVTNDVVTFATWNTLVDAVNENTSAISAGGIAANVVMASSSGTCPTGWTELTAARGRAIVARTGGGTVGTALTNLQDKTHTHPGPSHVHGSSSSGAHTHDDGSLAVASHSHGIDPGDEDAEVESAGGSASVSLDDHTHGGTASTGSTDVSGASAADGSHDHTTAAGGTAATSTAALSASLAYIQLIVCEKS